MKTLFVSKSLYILLFLGPKRIFSKDLKMPKNLQKKQETKRAQRKMVVAIKKLAAKNPVRKLRFTDGERKRTRRKGAKFRKRKRKRRRKRRKYFPQESSSHQSARSKPKKSSKIFAALILNGFTLLITMTILYPMALTWISIRYSKVCFCQWITIK